MALQVAAFRRHHDTSAAEDQPPIKVEAELIMCDFHLRMGQGRFFTMS